MVYVAIGLFIHRYDDIYLDNVSIFLIPDGPRTFIFRVEEYISSGNDKNIGDVFHSSCTCVAGKVGFCNHISALMLKVCKFSLYKARTMKDLRKEEDENPQLACTSQLQQWNKKGGGENIVPQPVVELVVKKPKLDEPSTSHGGGCGVKCLLYEARKHPKYDADTENVFLSELEKIDPNLGFAHINKAKSPDTEMAETKFGKSPVGSFLSYQTSLTESNFFARVDLTSVPRVNGAAPDLTHYPRFPLTTEEEMVISRGADRCRAELAVFFECG